MQPFPSVPPSKHSIVTSPIRLLKREEEKKKTFSHSEQKYNDII